MVSLKKLFIFKKKGKNKKSPPAKLTRVFSVIVTILITIIVSYGLIAVMPVRPMVVSGQSMYPTYSNGEFIWTYKLYSHPERKVTYGNVVVAYLGNISVIKRVVACPGDTVLIQDGILYVNGVKSEYNNGYDVMESAGSYYKVTLSDEEYYLLGDNRNHSSDSRVLGPTSKIEYIIKE